MGLLRRRKRRDPLKSNLSIDHGEITPTCHLGKPLRVCVVGDSLFLVCSKCGAEVGGVQARVALEQGTPRPRICVEGLVFSEEPFPLPRWRAQK